ncbi:O-acyltransferase like protein-like [Mizuhopecten yessoensis]|uniref:Nose resistant to fluoxetine protein 6 n=1 Tax=Mizuhopecten yessoensis TaxID=6573 RepID=A0A210PGP0_MIZYE|nr:O-acyltransferase like protein-like [Mizuhopecten yessoensis]OWF35674.1 Nose resistant to fluoxetine protein 6 [Mizuhopecten yessoensis]
MELTMTRFKMFALVVLTITVSVTNGQYFRQANATNNNVPKDIYTQGVMNFATSISSGGLNVPDYVQNAFALFNATSNILDNVDFNTALKLIDFAQSRNVSFRGVDNESLDLLYNALKFLQFLSTVGNSTLSSPGVDGIITGMAAGLTEVTRPMFDSVLKNLTLIAGANVPAMLTEVLGTGPEDLQTFLESANLDVLNFNPEAMLASLGVSPQCVQDLGLTTMSLTQSELWAIQMLDSMGKLREGILEGNIYFPGSYDECLNIVPPEFSTQYCLIEIGVSIMGYPAALKQGLCVPSTCNEADMLFLINGLLSTIPAEGSSTYASKAVCRRPTETKFDMKAIVALSICGLFVALMITSTAFDLLRGPCTTKTTTLDTSDKDEKKPKTIHEVHAPIPATFEKGVSVEFPSIIYKINSEDVKVPAAEHDIPKIYPTAPTEESEIPPKQKQRECSDGLLVKLFLSFSVWTNGKKLLNTDQGGALGAVNGIRFLSMTWVILGHTYSFSFEYVLNIIPFFSDIPSRWTFMVIINGVLSVDTFFTMSGLLVAYVFLKEMKKAKGRINWFMFYFHRFWRLTPPYMLVLMISATLFRYLGDGPEWPKDGLEIESCATTWWTNLLYINNFVHADKMCFGVAWYLANDMQFYILSPLMLVPLYFFKKIGVLVCAVFLLGVTVTTVIISATNNLPITFISTTDTTDYMMLYYIKPYCRMGPYIVGMLAGYVLYEKGLKIKINKYVNLFIWLVAAIVACMVLYGIYESANGNPVDVGLAALYNATSRSLWGACVSWVIFACATGNGGFVNTILSWKAFIPLGRLTYCAYLVHIILMYMNIFSARQHIYATDKTFIYLFLGYLVMSYLVAFVLSLAFEAPMMALEKALFRRGGGGKTTKSK